MARSPLIRTLQRLASEQAKPRGAEPNRAPCAKSGQPPREDVEHSCWASAPRPDLCSFRDCGRGIAGLSAALALKDAGFASTIYEASSRVGGRVYSDTTNWENGQKSGWCGEFIDSGHSTVLAWPADLG